MIKTDVVLQGGGYEAAISSKWGGCCYRLIKKSCKADVLRTPSCEQEVESTPFLYGNPILFPPNRIRGGSFTFEGREYRFPLNEPEHGCHLHGALYRTPFAVEEQSESYVRLSFTAKAGEYLGFLHAFKVTRGYRLDDNGLTEYTSAENLSEENMPFMLAFHTTFNLPFLKGTAAADCRMQMPVKEEYLRDGHFLPTGEILFRGERQEALSDGTYRPYGKSVSAFYKAAADFMRWTDEKSGISLLYRSDQAYGYRMLWKGEEDLIVAEPQTAAIDCFHASTPAEQNGLIIIRPKEKIVLKTRISVEERE